MTANSKKLKIAIPVGARVRMSKLGLLRSPKMAGRVGTVIGSAASGTGVRIRFDGLRSSETIHHSYLETIADKKRY
jgi:hypothetical protein